MFLEMKVRFSRCEEIIELLMPVNCRTRNGILNVADETKNPKHIETLSRFWSENTILSKNAYVKMTM